MLPNDDVNIPGNSSVVPFDMFFSRNLHVVQILKEYPQRQVDGHLLAPLRDIKELVTLDCPPMAEFGMQCRSLSASILQDHKPETSHSHFSSIYGLGRTGTFLQGRLL